ncbi:MAG: hypothetical protein OXC63_02640 [Aestuariivita sp.]|nr:hypothetical protein [Aestuariivita sp.]MCY4346450.1 hypothetical protein [Aestuariivita sp.]
MQDGYLFGNDVLRRDRVGRRAIHQRLDPIHNPLRRLLKLAEGPVGGVSLGYIVGPRIYQFNILNSRILIYL